MKLGHRHKDHILWAVWLEKILEVGAQPCETSRRYVVSSKAWNLAYHVLARISKHFNVFPFPGFWVLSSCGDGEGTGDHMIIKFTKCQDAPLGAGHGQGHGESDGHNLGQNGNKNIST